jgi:REP element-mobilizing transposase RayT
MPRPLRPQVAGGIYHLVSRGVRKLPVFTDDESRKRFLGLLDETLERYHWELHSWCLMTNHFHLLVTTVEPTVSDGMQYLNGCYGQWYDWRHGYEGHVFERRFWSQLIEGDGHLHEAARYILLNPVRAGMCATAPDWKWTSYRKTMGTTTKGPRLSTMLLYEFGRRLDIARKRFAAFIREAE